MIDQKSIAQQGLNFVWATLLVLTVTTFSFTSRTQAAVRVNEISPRCWWAGLDNEPVQIVIYGEGLNNCLAEVDGREMRITETIHPTNAHYLILYIDMSKAQPQKFNIVLTSGKKVTRIAYELKSRRNGAYAQGFDASDVVYLLMPDRFANDNHENDIVRTCQDQIVSREGLSARHGGDLTGITTHLDYLKNLGVTTIWPTPVQINNVKEGSYHGYAITDYYEIDPRFGGNEAYRQFVDEAHEKDMKVIMDMVFNHCGTDNYLFRDMPDTTWFHHGRHYVQTNFETSAPSDTYAASAVEDQMEKGWFTQSMPDWNQQNRFVADYLIQNSIWWIEYAGIDGIRQDTYPYCDFNMMARWCRRLENLYPHINIVGETWSDNDANVAYWQKDSRINTKNSYLPTVMDFPLMSILNNYKGAESLQAIYKLLTGDIVYADPMHLLTFLGNHDTSRFCHNVQEATDLSRYQQALTLLLTLRGIPQLYYGTEIMMEGDKSHGDGAIRHDFPGGWEGDSVNVFTEKNLTPIQSEALRFTRRLLTWRRGNEVIAKGTTKHYPIRDGVYVYQRKYGEKAVAVLINGTDQERTLPTDDYREALSAKGQFRNIVNGDIIEIGNTLTLRPKETIVIENSCLTQPKMGEAN